MCKPERTTPDPMAKKARFLRAVLDMGSAGAADTAVTAPATPAAHRGTSEAGSAPTSDGAPTDETEGPRPAP